MKERKKMNIRELPKCFLNHGKDPIGRCGNCIKRKDCGNTNKNYTDLEKKYLGNESVEYKPILGFMPDFHPQMPCMNNPLIIASDREFIQYTPDMKKALEVNHE
jgi:hypothetical protein